MATDPRIEGMSDEEIKQATPLLGHMTRPMTNVGTSDPAGDKEETPTEDLPPVKGNQFTERVQVGDEPAPAEPGDEEKPPPED